MTREAIIDNTKPRKRQELVARGISLRERRTPSSKEGRTTYIGMQEWRERERGINGFTHGGGLGPSRFAV